MKNRWLTLAFLVLTSCSIQENKDRTLVEGTYVTSYENEFNKGMDTIQIVPLNREANTYYYIRRVGYQRIRNGAWGPQQLKTDRSTCVFDEKTAQLHEQSKGRTYSLTGAGDRLITGGASYQRIN